MPRKATGNTYESRGRWYARITLDKGERPSIPLPTCADVSAAERRGAVLADLTAQLRAAGVPLDVWRKLVERAGEAADGKALAKVQKAAADICSGAAVPIVDGSTSVTIRDVDERWTSGELARRYPDHVKARKRAGDDGAGLARYVYPIAGHVPIVDFTIDHAEAVMRTIPAERSRTTRRNLTLLLHRILAMAVFPLRVIKAHPLPRGFLPKPGPSKAKGWIFPDEDRKLLRCADVPLCFRVLYGFLAREGMRFSEAGRLDVGDVDLVRGAIRLDENKTDDARAWALSPGMVPALRAWLAVRFPEGNPPARAPLFVDEAGERFGDESTAWGRRVGGHHAARFRDHLQLAGVDRPELFEQSKTRMRIRAHDMRATFITIALACGRSEAWVADRTGHKSSIMINTYRRAARTAAELGLGELTPLDVAIPELAATGADGGEVGKGGAKGAATSSGGSTEPEGDAGRRHRSPSSPEIGGSAQESNLPKTAELPRTDFEDRGWRQPTTRFRLPF